MDQQRRPHTARVDRKIKSDFITSGRLKRGTQDRPRPLDLSTSAKLRYLDDDRDEDTQDHRHPDQDLPEDNEQNYKKGVEMFEKIKDHKRHNPGQDLQATNLRLDDLSGHREKCYNNKIEEIGDEEDTASLEEVYLCNCCGITRPLDPAMKYIRLFRNSFLLFNFLVFAFNFANLAIGLWLRIDPKVYEIHKYIETQNFTYAGYILLGGGLVGCLTSLAGFTAAARTTRNTDKQPVCLLISYALTMTLMTIAFIGALVLLTVYGLGGQLERHMTKEMYEQMRRRQMSSPESGMLVPNQNDATQFLDFVQVKLRCCGAQDWRDYNKLGLIVPTTCYTHIGPMVDAPGCGRALREIFDVRAGLATGTTAASVMSQLVAILLASLMVCAIYNYRARPRPASAVCYRDHSASPNNRVTTSPPLQLGLPV